MEEITEKKASKTVKVLGKAIKVEQTKEVMMAVHDVAIKPFHRGKTVSVLKTLGVSDAETLTTHKVAGAYLDIIDLWVAQGGDINKKKTSCCS